MAAPTYVGGTSGNASSGTSTSPSLTSLTGGSDSSPSIGDIVYCWTNQANSNGQSVSGYTLLGSTIVTDLTYAGYGKLYRKVLTAADTSLTINFNNTNICWTIMVVRGGDPDLLELQVYNPGTNTGQDPASLTTGRDNSMVLAFCCGENGNAGSGGYMATPSNMTGGVHEIGPASTVYLNASSAYYVQATAGAFNPGTFANSNSGVHAYMTVELAAYIDRPPFVGSDSVGYAGRTSGSDTWNFSLSGGVGGLASGDKMFCFVSTEKANGTTARISTSGWSREDNYANTGDTYGPYTELWTKTSDGTETSITFVGSLDNADGFAAALYVFRDCSYSVETRETGTNSGNPDPGSKTLNAGQIGLWFGATHGGLAGPTINNYTISDLLHQEIIIGNDTYDTVIGAGWYPGAGSSFNPAAWSGNSSSSLAWTCNPVIITLAVWSLSINSATHAHAADGVTVSSKATLSINDATHAHAADQATLSNVHNAVTINDATHAHSADNATITSKATLTIADARHDFYSDPYLYTNRLTYSEARQGGTNSWFNNGSSSSDLAGSYEIYPGYTVRGVQVDSLGATWHRLRTPQQVYLQNVTYPITFWYVEGTSGSNMTFEFYDNSSGLVNGAVNVVSGVPGSFANGATITNIVRTDLGGGIKKVSFDWTPTLRDTNVNSFGLGPRSAVSGENIIALAVMIQSDEPLSPGYIETTGSQASKYFGSDMTVTWAGSIAPTDTTHSHTADSPTVSFSANITPDDATHSHTADIVTMAGPVLTINDAAHAHATDNVTLTSKATISAADATHSHTADNLTLTAYFSLTISDATHGHAADNVTVTWAGSVTIQDAVHAHASDNLSVTFAAAVSVNDATHSHLADNVTIATAAVILPADALHSHTADQVVMAGPVVSVNDALHSHSADVVTMAGPSLVIADALHSHTADNVTLSAAAALLINDALHAQTADSLTIAFYAQIAPQDAVHAHSADNVSLTTFAQINVSEALHGHTADNVSIIVPVYVDDALHAHTADQVGLIVPVLVNDALHSHTADNVTLDVMGTLSVHDATHAHLADNVTVSFAAAIVVADATHAHYADQVVMVGPVLSINEALHDHTADHVTIGYGLIILPDDSVLAHYADPVTVSFAAVVSVNDALHGHTADNLTLTTASTVSVNDATHTHAADSVVVSWAGSLAISDALHVHISDNVTVTTANMISVNDALHSHAADSLIVSWAGSVSVNDATHSHTVDNVTVASAATISVDDATHTLISDQVTLTFAAPILVNDALHGHTADQVAVTTVSFITPANCLHGHTAEALTIVLRYFVVPDSCNQLHTADSVTLIAANDVVPDGALHAHFADEVGVTAGSWGTAEVNDALHDHTAGNVTISVRDRSVFAIIA